MALSPFDDPKREPSEEEVGAMLGDAHAAWVDLAAWLRREAGVERFEWGFAGKKFGWSLRAEATRRRIAYLIPQRGAFLVGLVLGDRAVAAARDAPLTAAARAILDAAPRYGEGTGFRLPVATPADLGDVRALVGLKVRF